MNVPVSSTGRERGRVATQGRFKLRGVTCCVMLAFADASWANPTGASVAAGAARLDTAGKTLTVTNAPGTIINWRSFSVGAGEHTRFLQQSAASAVLNRVVGSDVSSILGTLTSNGRVFLVNPHGIVFGPGAVINTAGFIASTLNMSDQDFLQGKLRFEGGGGGLLRNEGTLRATGDIMLVGPAIENAGLIRSDAGSVLLAAGKALTITSPDAHGVTFTLQAPSDTAVNIGTIEAANAGGMFAGTLRHSGDMRIVNGGVDGAGRLLLIAQSEALVQSGSTLSASGAQGGSITVQSGGQTLVSGAIDASGSDKGGNIKLLGRDVGVLTGATLDASGGAGGGTILIGGDYKGTNPAVQNALHTYIGADAAIRADATTSGDGGRIIVWSDEATRVHGLISARGAGPTSKGGFVETSGHYLEVTRAPEIGAGGTWLLDPRNIEVVSTATTNNSGPPNFTPTNDDSQILNTQINNQLDAGTNVVLDTGNAASPGGQAGNITVNAIITKGMPNTSSLTFNAANSITINQPVDLSVGGDVNMTTANTTGTVTVNREVRAGNAMNFNLAGGFVVNANAGASGLFSTTGQTITARSITLNGNGTISAGMQNSTSGNQTITAGLGGLTLAAASSSPIINQQSTTGNQSITVNNGGGIALTGGSSMNASALIQNSGPTQTITVNNGGVVSLTGGSATQTSAIIQNSGAQQLIDFTAAGTLNLQAGSGSNNSSAFIENIGTGATLQRITFTGGGGINITGGSVGMNNAGEIRAFRGDQTIAGNANITLLGGPSGGGVSNENSAVIALEGTGTQTVNAGNISITGGAGGTGNAAAFITDNSGSTSNITTTGSVTLTGGAGTDALAAIGSVTGNINLTLNATGPVNLTGGSGAVGAAGFGAQAAIGTIGAFNANATVNSQAAITLTKGPTTGADARIGSTTAGGTVSVNAGGGGSANLALNGGIIGSTGNVSVAATNNINVADGLISASGSLTVAATQNLNVTATAVPSTIRTLGTQSQTISANGITVQSAATAGAGISALISASNAQTITAGAGGITLTGGGGGSTNSALIQQIGTTTTQSISVNGGGNIVVTGGSTSGNSNQAQISAAGTSQTINFGASGNLQLAGGTNGTLNTARITQAATATTSTQTITGATGISLTGGANGGGTDANNNGLGNSARIISNNGSQTISVGAGGISLTGGGGLATNNFAEIIQAPTPNALVTGTSQTITINNGGALALQGGSSAQTNVIGGPNNPNNFFRGSFTNIQSNGDTQQFSFPNGGAINLTGGTVGSNNVAQLQLRFGNNQMITGAPTITLTGGASGGTQNGTVNEGNRARIVSSVGNQNITAGAINLTGGAGGMLNSTQIITSAAGTSQTIGASGITLRGGPGGGGFVTGPFSTRGNFAQISAGGDQTVTVGAAGIVMSGGSGTLTDNFASLIQNDTGVARRQQITVNGGGPITLTGGSSAATSAGVSGSGSFAFITADGGAGQTIDFGAAGSAITLTGGTVGTGNNAGFLARNGQQTLTGSPTITMIGGASGGIPGDNNAATIEATVGTQTITAGTTQITGGPGGIDNSATIRSPNQNITINGNLTQTGSTGGMGATGARIGPLNNQAGATALMVNGSITLNGGGVASSGASIGISGQATVMQNATFTVSASGDVTLNGGTAGFARIGQPAALLGGGDISVVSTGGSIVLAGDTATGGQINTTGNVTVTANSAGKSIFEVGANSLIRANTLTASAHSGITLDGNNAVTNFNASNSTANGVQFTQAAGSLLTLTGMAQTGGQVRVTADDINITGAINAGANPVTLRPTTLARNVNIETTPTAGTLSLSPTELNFINAAQLDVGRFDGTGTLSVPASFANTDINASTFRLLSGADMSITGSFGGTETEFDNSFFALANNNLNITGTTLLFANGQTVSLRADHDASGAGNLTISNSSGSARTILAGTSSANTASMTLQGQNVTVGGGTDGIFISLNGTGTQTIAAAGNLLVQAAGSAQGNTGVQASNGVQNVSAAGITLTAATAGSNNSATLVAGSQTVIAGAGGIVATAGGGTSVNSNTAAITQTSSTGTQTVTINGGGSIQLQAGSGSGTQNTAQISAFGTSQQINFASGGNLQLTGGTTGGLNLARVRTTLAGSSQTITGVTGITLTGGANGGGAITTPTPTSLGNFAQISAAGNQSIGVSSGGILLAGGGGTLTDNFAQIVQNGTGAGSSQSINFTGGGSLTAVGGSSAGTNGVVGSTAEIAANGLAQSLIFAGGGSISLTGGTVGAKNNTQLRNSNNSGTQTITGVAGITLQGGASGGIEGPTTTSSFGNFAQLRGNGTQQITVGAGGIMVIGGSGNADNFAQIRQGPVTGGPTPGTSQSIMVTNGGAITLQAGSTSAVATANGNGSFARIRGEGDSQTINFTGGGAINLTGGTVGTSNNAQIFTDSGTQTITGSPTLTMTGGSSGGATNDGNFARIQTTTTQTLTLGGTQLISGSGGVDNFSSIQSPNQTITVNGGLAMTGSSGTTGAAGARIGGIRDGVTNLALTVSGAVALTGGSTTNGGSALGPSALSTVAQPATITLNAGGDVTLGGGTVAGTRIGHRDTLLAGGDIVVNAGGNIALNGSATGIAAVRTQGNVTLRANAAGKSVNAGTNSALHANVLTAEGNAGVTLAGIIEANQLNVTSGGGDITFSNMQSIDVSNSTVTTPPGAQTVTITTIGATSDITVSGTVTSDDNFVLTSGRDVLFNAGANVTGASASLSGPGSARFPGGTVTLNIPVTSAMPFNIGGAIVNVNGATTLNNGLTLSGGALQGSGAVNLNGGTFAWSGGTVTGTGLFTTNTTMTSITGPVGFHTRTWNNAGAVSETGAARLQLLNNAVINNQALGTWDVSSTDPMPLFGGGSFNNAGTFSNSGATAHAVPITAFTNTGQLNVVSGTLTLPTFPINNGRMTVSAGAVLSTSGANLTNNGTIGGGGMVNLAGATLTNNLTVAPGTSPGTLVIDGNYTQGPNGVLAIDIGGTTQGVDFDLLRVTGVATLGGTLQVNTFGGFTPGTGSVFDFLTYASRSGDFAQVTSSGGAVTFQPVPNLTSYGVLATSAFTSGAAQMIASVAATNVVTLSEGAPGTEESREEEKARADVVQSREEQTIKASEQQCR